MMVTASAPISGDVLEFLKICFSCPVLEAYGMSETLGAVTFTPPDDPIQGTVGGPAPTYTVRLKDLPENGYSIHDDPFPRGEICMGGPCMFKGYFNNPAKTAEILDEDGFVHSGDVGVLYPNGTVRILDRCKNIFKLAQGEYVAPEKLENIYIQSPLIAQIMVYGDSLKHCTVAIVVIEAGPLGKWAEENGTKPDEVVSSQNADYKKLIMSSMKEYAVERKLNSLEQPKDIYFTLDAFSVENDILTPTFKLKRNVGTQIYKAQIDALYAKIGN